ncbi:TIR domain-containing protein [Clostridium gasigenes]|uniref:Thoeris protein ThsB TIR-like domain-containing protein n=1 Tax=Clostridium gasigenes TaxID=94869 RepID=A0A1H0MDI0_9CLOT|nr:hypothetical protein [Clostridium gasigenes]MBB6713733.1 hypothetical protein [Clostridium gasigenes]SDO78417.1 hypothetical protein SAMN04488529_101418 [Clostridium gasigenes]
MSYRNGVYVAFNGCGTAVPTKSDIAHYDMLKVWKANDDIDFTFVDSHEKTKSVRDTSDREKTLYPRLQERFRSSKVLFLIVTENTKNSS